MRHGRSRFVVRLQILAGQSEIQIPLGPMRSSCSEIVRVSFDRLSSAFQDRPVQSQWPEPDMQ